MDIKAGSSVASSTHKPLSDAEVQELQTNRTTEGILKNAARAAGMSVMRANGEGEIAFTGEDRTYDEVLAERKASTVVEAAVELKHVALHLASSSLEGVVVGGLLHAAEVSGGVIASGLALHGYVKSIELGHRVQDAVLQDALHVAMLANLEGLPDGYVDGELALRKEVHGSYASPMMKVAEQLKLNPKLTKMIPVLQRHCDEGMHAAEALLAEGGRDANAFFDTHPGFADGFRERYRTDAAFHAGFDAVLWAQKQAEDPNHPDDGPLRALRAGLHERDEWLRPGRAVQG